MAIRQNEESRAGRSGERARRRSCPIRSVRSSPFSRPAGRRTHRPPPTARAVVLAENVAFTTDYSTPIR